MKSGVARRAHDKVRSNVEGIKARGGPVIAVTTEGDEETAARADDAICVA